MEELYAQGAVSRQQSDQAQANRDQAIARRQEQEEAWRRAQAAAALASFAVASSRKRKLAAAARAVVGVEAGALVVAVAPGMPAILISRPRISCSTAGHKLITARRLRAQRASCRSRLATRLLLRARVPSSPLVLLAAPAKAAVFICRPDRFRSVTALRFLPARLRLGMPARLTL